MGEEGGGVGGVGSGGGGLGNINQEILPEPYIPFVLDDWNGGLVLAEVQNHSAKSREYLEWLRGLWGCPKYPACKGIVSV